MSVTAAVVSERTVNPATTFFALFAVHSCFACMDTMDNLLKFFLHKVLELFMSCDEAMMT